MVGSMIIFFVKQNTADEMRISDGSSDVCSSDLNCNRMSASAYQELHIPLRPCDGAFHNIRDLPALRRYPIAHLRANACMNRGVANNPALADFSASRFELRLDERNQACGRRRKAEGPLQHLRKRDEAGITTNKRSEERRGGNEGVSTGRT